jgi:hypothetical protein
MPFGLIDINNTKKHTHVKPQYEYKSITVLTQDLGFWKRNVKLIEFLFMFVTELRICNNLKIRYT